ncbi:MAG: OsmC family protein [Burkholderiales bacterium]|nr:OsmC family protein [Burkholderiales bacterium]
MTVVREKTTIKMRMEGTAQSHSRTDVAMRGLTKIIDEPVERGGTNLGMSPTETFAASLIGCTNVISHKIAHKHGIEFQAMRIRLEADFDRRGVTLQEDVAVPFPAMVLHIDVTTRATPEEIATVQRELAMYCPIAKLIRASGTTLTEHWTIIAP